MRPTRAPGRKGSAEFRRSVILPLALVAAGVCTSAIAKAEATGFRFRVHYLGMSAGELTFTARDSLLPQGERVRVVQVEMRTASLPSTLFLIDNTYRAIYSPERLQLIAIQKRVRQRNLEGEWRIRYSGTEAVLRRLGQQADSARWSPGSACLEVICLMDFLLHLRHPDTTFTVPVDEEAAPMEAQVRIFRDHERSYALALFRQRGPSSRRWRTDLLTNRFSKTGARLEIYFDPQRPNVPKTVRYSLGSSMATAELIEPKGARR
jgi:hypothetical protein